MMMCCRRGNDPAARVVVPGSYVVWMIDTHRGVLVKQPEAESAGIVGKVAALDQMKPPTVRAGIREQRPENMGIPYEAWLGGSIFALRPVPITGPMTGD